MISSTKFVFLLGLVTLSSIKSHPSHHHGHHEHDHSEYLSRELPVVQSEQDHSSLYDFFFHTGEKKRETVLTCGQADPTSKELDEGERTVRKWIEYKKSTGIQALETVEIPTFVHIITDGIDGDKSDDDILTQMEILNNGFQSTGFLFTLVEITRTVNESWYGEISFRSQLEFDMKSTLRQGNASTLNIYVAGNLPTQVENQILLGFATFPFWYEEDPLLDGVVLNTESIQGGEILGISFYGGTAIHEVGHWMGLYHTFQGSRGRFPLRNGCTTRGDFVGDTPAQKNAEYGCPTLRNTCRLRRGNDPINNFMGYSDDLCRNEFTAGQIERMQAFWNEYRVSE